MLGLVVGSLLLSLVLGFADPTPTRAPRLRLSRRVCLEGQCELVVLSFRTPHPSDRTWTLGLYRQGEDLPEIHSEVSVEGVDGDTARRAVWQVPGAGEFDVVSCVLPEGGCSRLSLTVQPAR